MWGVCGVEDARARGRRSGERALECGRIHTVQHVAADRDQRHERRRAAQDERRGRIVAGPERRPSRRTATRSASMPGRERAAVGEAERARAVERRHLQRRSGRERLGIARARARQEKRRAQLVEEVERERRRRAVGADADADARGAQARDGATPQPRRALERGQWATAAPLAASAAMSSSSTCTACATTVSGPSRPRSASSRIGWRPKAPTNRASSPCRAPSRRARGATRRGA